jgi:hypothetical protein
LSRRDKANKTDDGKKEYRAKAHQGQALGY